MLFSQKISFKWNKDIDNFNKQFNEPFGDISNNGDNILLSDKVSLSFNVMKTRRNNNVIVVDDNHFKHKSSFIIRNILQGKSNFVVFDINKHILEETEEFLTNEGYQIEVFDITNPNNLLCYDPFKHMQWSSEIADFIDCLILNVSNDINRDIFSEIYERKLLTAILFFMKYYLPETDFNIATVYNILEKAISDDPSIKSGFEEMLENKFKKSPNDTRLNTIINDFNNFNTGPAVVKKSTVISLFMKLKKLYSDKIGQFLLNDNMEFYKSNDVKKALFVIVPHDVKNIHPIVPIMCSQFFSNIVNNPKLQKTHHHIFIRSFFQVGCIPNLAIKLASTRSINAATTIIVKKIPDLGLFYRKEKDVIIDNCDSLVFNTCKEDSTKKYLIKSLGGTNNFSVFNPKKTKSEDVVSAEIDKINDNECVVLIRGILPFKDKKL